MEQVEAVIPVTRPSQPRAPLSLAGLGVVGWRIARGIRARAAVVNATASATPPE